MKRIGLLLAAFLLTGTLAVAQSGQGQDQGSGNSARQDNYGQKRRRLAHHQNRERDRLRDHQRAERRACQVDPNRDRCKLLRAHQKRERKRLQNHQQRERRHARNYRRRHHQPGGRS